MALDLIAQLEAIIDALADDGIEYAVCGGLALGILGHPRMSAEGLVTMKTLANRPQDLADIAALQQGPDDEDA